MRNLLPLVSSTVLFGFLQGPAQPKEATTTLQEDWKVLCSFHWVHTKPNDAWDLLDERWKKAFALLHPGAKSWSKIELSFADGNPNVPVDRYNMAATWYYLDRDGKEQTSAAVWGNVIDLREEKGQRFWLKGGGKSKVKFALKKNLLILDGIEKTSKNAMPRVFTGQYKGIERKEGRPPDKASKGKKPAYSKLWREFDPKSPLAACQAHFDEIDENGARAGLSFGKSPDTYKLFNAAGKISADKLKQLLATLKTDLHKMAKGSGVEKVGEPSDKVEDRPISVLRAMYSQRLIMPGSVRGFYLTYRDGKVAGAIDVIAVLNSSTIDRWEICCAVHEVVPE